jgi:ubiquinone/menaquinone biosynthesis C-methylase UbiE
MASATRLPFDDDEFEAVFSSDVMEHLEPGDVDTAIAEMFRVASKYVVLQIAIGPTKSRWGHITGVDQVHLTQMSASDWSKKFDSMMWVAKSFSGISKHHAFYILSKRDGIDDRLSFYAKLYDSMHEAGMVQSMKGNGTAFIKQVASQYKFDTVLDVGAGNGGDSLLMTKMGKTVIPIDVSERTLVTMRERGLNCLKASGTDLPFGDNSFDMIMAIDFMEHLREKDVYVTLAEFYRVTRRYVALQIGTAPAKGPFPNSAGYNLDNIHLSIWPPKKWTRRFKKAGFEILEATITRPPHQRGTTKLFFCVLEKPSATTN